MKITRRSLLQTLAAGLGAVAINPLLTACGKQQNQQPGFPTPTGVSSTNVPTPTTPPTAGAVAPTATSSGVETAPTPAPPATPAPIPDMAVARGGDEPEKLVRAAIAALGGMEKFVPQGAKVIVKPNICVAYHTYEYAATTNPWVVGALVKMCLEAGASSVKVLDYPFGGSAKEAYAISGIEEQVKNAGGEMAFIPGYKYVTAKIPQGKKLRHVDIFSDILKTDVVIDVPIAKHHSLSGLTLAMKNLMGVIADRGAMHADLGQMLADLASLVQPKLSVVDAVRILMNNGPTGGDLNDVKQMNTVIASADIVAVDAYATTLFGKKPEDIASIPAAAAMGLGRMDLENMKIEEINVAA